MYCPLNILQIMKKSFKETGIVELQNLGVGTQALRISLITAYRTEHTAEDMVRCLAKLAAHEVATQNRSYDFSTRSREALQTVRELQRLRQTVDPNKVANWMRLDFIDFILF